MPISLHTRNTGRKREENLNGENVQKTEKNKSSEIEYKLNAWNALIDLGLQVVFIICFSLNIELKGLCV